LVTSLVAEGEVLARLRHPNVVEYRKTLSIAGRTALLMSKAGDRTLAQRLRDEARLSLDLLRRVGEELIQTTDYLEQQGVAHRDIKPENIGMSQVGTKGKLQLVLFDFSLSRASPDNIAAGTIESRKPSSTAPKP
jgi:serine/threonine protein kinase